VHRKTAWCSWIACPLLAGAAAPAVVLSCHRSTPVMPEQGLSPVPNPDRGRGASNIARTTISFLAGARCAPTTPSAAGVHCPTPTAWPLFTTRPCTAHRGLCCTSPNKSSLDLLVDGMVNPGGEPLTAMETWTGIADKVDLVTPVRPAMDMNLDFHDGKRSATASTKACNSDLFSRQTAMLCSKEYRKCTVHSIT
jgi:hypothetical protein